MEIENYDRDLLEPIIAEYMADAGKGRYKAIDYAMVESSEFRAHLAPVIMSIMRIGAMYADPLFNQISGEWIKMASGDLLKVLQERVAPTWAAREYDRRRADNLEMQAEGEARP